MWQSEVTIKTCIDDHFDILLVSIGAAYTKDDYSFTISRNNSRYHLFPCMECKPIRCRARCPTRTHQISAPGRWASRRSDAARALSSMTYAPLSMSMAT